MEIFIGGLGTFVFWLLGVMFWAIALCVALEFAELLAYKVSKGWHKAETKYKKITTTIEKNWNISPELIKAIAQAFKAKK